MGVDMDLDFKLMETGSLLMTILVTALVLQVIKNQLDVQLLLL